MENKDHFPLPPVRQLQHVQNLFGRWYGSDSRIRRSKYIFPIDEEECDRLDMFHEFFRLARNDVLFSAPVQCQQPLRILDLGTGTGIWPVEVAKAFPQISVLGVDLNMIQPRMIPQNMEPPIELDIEGSWENVGHDWDLIHARTLFGSVQCWEKMYSKIFRHLKPGTGFWEQVELDLVPQCDYGHIKDISPLSIWANKLLHAMEKHGRSIKVFPYRTREQLALAGFEDIHEETTKVCLSPWSNSRHERCVARWFNIGLCHALTAFSYAPMIQYLGMSKDEVDQLCGDMAKEMCSLEHRAYCKLYVWTARRPL